MSEVSGFRKRQTKSFYYKIFITFAGDLRQVKIKSRTVL